MNEATFPDSKQLIILLNLFMPAVSYSALNELSELLHWTIIHYIKIYIFL